MDNAINKYKQRRDARLKKRLDEEWITMNGTHVLIDDEGQVSKGPSTLKSLVEKSGGHKKKSGVTDLRKPGSANMNKGPNSPSAGKYVETLEKGGMKANTPEMIRGEERSFMSGGKTWDKESLTKLWQDRGYSKKQAEARAEKDLNETLAATKKNREAEEYARTGAEAARDRMIERGKNGGEDPDAEKKSYEKIPLAFSIGGSQYATPEEKKKRREIISGFMNDAKEGDVYSVGGGVGSSGGSRFKVTKSRGKLALQWENSRYKPVEMSRANVEKFLKNGATLVKRG